jgi:hypothetical protein
VDRIFSEIKKAIEEELAQQESTRRPGQRGSVQRRPPVRDVPPEQRWPDEPEQRFDEAIGAPRDARDAARMDDERRRQQERDRQRQHPDAQREQRQSETRAARQAKDAARRRERMMREATRHEERPRVQRQEASSSRRSSPLRAIIRQTLRTTSGVRHAILLSEVFGRPVSMRSQDDHLP